MSWAGWLALDPADGNVLQAADAARRARSSASDGVATAFGCAMPSIVAMHSDTASRRRHGR